MLRRVVASFVEINSLYLILNNMTTVTQQDRSVGHVRLDRDFNFKEFEYDTPENYICKLQVSGVLRRWRKLTV
jgi:hypothetical protein